MCLQDEICKARVLEVLAWRLYWSQIVETAGWLPLYSVECTDNGGKDEELSWVGF
jgi:hypothetical protein